jgi:hypothetical protein
LSDTASWKKKELTWEKDNEVVRDILKREREEWKTSKNVWEEKKLKWKTDKEVEKDGWGKRELKWKSDSESERDSWEKKELKWKSDSESERDSWEKKELKWKSDSESERDSWEKKELKWKSNSESERGGWFREKAEWKENQLKWDQDRHVLIEERENEKNIFEQEQKNWTEERTRWNKNRELSRVNTEKAFELRRLEVQKIRNELMGGFLQRGVVIERIKSLLKNYWSMSVKKAPLKKIREYYRVNSILTSLLLEVSKIDSVKNIASNTTDQSRGSAIIKKINVKDFVEGEGKGKEELISIITIVRNDAEGFLATSRSILQQDYKNIDWVVIDGMSNDGTSDFVRKLASKIGAYIIEEDSGIYNAMNKGVQLVSGEWLFFMNAGDVFESNNVVSLYAQAAQNYPDIDVFYSNAVRQEDGCVHQYRSDELHTLGMVFDHQTAMTRTIRQREYSYDESLKVGWKALFKNR